MSIARLEPDEMTDGRPVFNVYVTTTRADGNDVVVMFRTTDGALASTLVDAINNIGKMYLVSSNPG